MSTETKVIIPTFVRVGGDDPETDLNQWLKGIPDTFTAKQALDASASALAMGAERINKVRDQYSGTLPPSPWPATPEVRKGLEEMGGARDFFGKIASVKPEATWTKNDKAWIALSRAAGDLFGALDELEHKSANAPALRDLLALVPDPRSLILGRFPIRDVALAGVAAYLLFPQVKRIVRRTLGVGVGRARRA